MKEDRIDFKQMLGKVRKYWYLYLIIFPIAVGLAIMYLRITPKKYEATSMLLIKDEEKSGQLVEEAIFDELGILGKKKKSLENEVLILRSTPLMESVVQNLELQYTYLKLEFMKKTDLYDESPVRVVDWKPNSDNEVLEAKLNFNNKGGYLLEADKREYQGEFGKELRIPAGKLTLSFNRSKEAPEKMGLVIIPSKEKAKELVDGLEVSAVGEQSSTLTLTFKDVVPTRAESVLTELITLYNQQSIDEKNSVYENSLSLLNERINLISRELAEAEQNVESYKRRFNIAELSVEGSMLMKEMADYNKEIAGTDVQLEILNSIEDFLQRNSESFEFVPTNININNLTLTSQITNFNDLLRQRERERNIKGPSHPDLILIEKQIRNLRQTIIANVRSIKADIQISRNAKRELSTGIENRMQSLPTRERELLDKERQKNLTENIYVYLLQKREQSAISLASTTATGRVIEPAEASDPVSPKAAQVLLIALFLGLALPTGIIFMVESLNDKVMTEEDVQRLTPATIAGILAASRKKSRLVVKENSNSAAAEMFRLLRANLAYIMPGERLKTLLVTSGVPGEGKSFIALNLGVTQALAGKKVLLLELDLRKPSQEFESLEDTDDGIVNYLVDPDVTLDMIIQNTGLHLNFDVIQCGAKPPNPSELLLSPKLRDLLKVLKEKYDFIILDTPPVGVVADALQMKEMADATMFVARSGYTKKAEFQIINDIIQKDKLPRPFIVLNGVKLNKRGYGSGYYSSYYSED
ncbi:MAG: polysaccharide biosynthesis tyrosine autokinase [Saprospiraceae bacterium]|nr:polysaccharide biosynthesis tyrosine autokinase [Saprospiraceae bacterium]MCB0576445.1 polysaccharide biosynthesis tyrosine autokinase [Saprospiraceae bacterium]MCB9305437.1 polysaccharide biosynthesis tyrosine autokinase [Lewinellaceae bacterium]